MKTPTLSAVQEQVIELLATGRYTQKAAAEALSIHGPQISLWKKDKTFMEALVTRSREMLRENLPQIYAVLSDKSIEGNDRHIKIFLDHLERLEQIRSNDIKIEFRWGSDNDEEAPPEANQYGPKAGRLSDDFQNPWENPPEKKGGSSCNG